MRPRMEQEFAFLRESYPALEHKEKAGEDWFLLPRFPFPDGWRLGSEAIEEAPLCFPINGAYPSGHPYSFSVKSKHLASIKELLDTRKVKLDLALYDTPSKIKKALKGRGRATEADTRCVVEVAFSSDAVTVGDRTYPIQRGNGVPRIHVGKSSKLNVEVLKRLLCDPT
jgi:hypothetical protein